MSEAMAWTDDSKEMSSMTIGQFERVCSAIVEQRAACEEMSRLKKDEDAKLEKLELSFMELLKKEDRTNFPSKLGLFSVRHLTSFRLPKSPEDKAAYYKWLKKKKLFDAMISVNSNTFNSHCKAEVQRALDEGKEIEGLIPGVEAPTIKEVLAFKPSN